MHEMSKWKRFQLDKHTKLDCNHSVNGKIAFFRFTISTKYDILFMILQELPGWPEMQNYYRLQYDFSLDCSLFLAFPGFSG